MLQNATVISKLTQRMLNTIKRGLQSVFGEFLNKKVCRYFSCSALTKRVVCNLSDVSFTADTTNQQETVNLRCYFDMSVTGTLMPTPIFWGQKR